MTKNTLEKHKQQQSKFQHDITINDLKDSVKSLKDEKSELLKYVSDLETQIHFIDQIKKSSVKNYEIKPNLKLGTGEATAIGCLSDFHSFELVDPKTVNFKNEYNKAIAVQRYKNFFSGFLKWVNIHRTGTSIKEGVIFLGGDNIHGAIHEEYAESTAGTNLEEVIFVLGILKSGINFLLESGLFDHLVIICCDGNHSRTTEKIHYSKRVKHSLEWMMHNVLAMDYRDNKKIDFKIEESYHVFQQIYDYKFRFHHGDYISYGGGVGGITIPANKAILNWNKTEAADYDVFGHFHQFLWETNFISNGSGVGHNPFSIAIKAPYQPPRQTLILVDKKRGVTSVNPIYLSTENN